MLERDGNVSGMGRTTLAAFLMETPSHSAGHGAEIRAGLDAPDGGLMGAQEA